MNYEDHQDVIQLLKDDQHAEYDMRESIREEIDFVHDPQGQWETRVWNQFNRRPRYTFDQTSPAISKIWAEMAANDFSATVQPVGDGADEDTANVINGLRRAIYEVSSFHSISKKAGKRMIGTGFSAWRIISTYIGESFYQDLKIIPLHDAENRVWFDANSQMQTREDAMHCFVLSEIGLSEAKSRWKDRDVFEDVSREKRCDVKTYKPLNQVVIGEILYKKPIKKTIYRLDDGTITDEMPLGFDANEDNSREITAYQVYSRKFDNAGWLEDKKKTAFTMIPVIPEYANFEIVDGKVMYHGIIRKFMDPQRVYNYSESKKIEDSVLGRMDKIFATPEQVEKRVEEFAALNRDPRPVQLYKHVDGQPPPFPMPGSQPTAATSEVSADMIKNMQLILNMPNALTEAEASRRDSDFRSDQRNQMGQVGTYEYYEAHRVALEYTDKILLDGMRVIYDSERAQKIIDESGQASEVIINQNQNGKILHDLTTGKYDITVKVSKDMQSRKAAANDGIKELAAFDPSIVTRNTDFLASNIDAPGMQSIADREREYLFKQGLIPESQWTDEEKEKAAIAAQQPKEPDPAQMLAMAEVEKVKNLATKAQYDALGKQADLELKQQQQQIQAALESFKMEMEQMKQEREKERADYQNLLDLTKSIENLAKTGQTIDNQVLTSAQQEITEDE